MERPKTGISLGGRILSELTSQPVADASLVLYPYVSTDLGFRFTMIQRYAEAVGETDAQGRFLFLDLPRSGKYVLVLLSPDYPNARIPVEAGRTDHVLRVRRGGLVRGRVLDLAGAPVEGASVALLDHARRDLMPGAVCTNADGSYAFPPQEEGPYSIIAVHGPKQLGMTEPAINVQVQRMKPVERNIRLGPPVTVQGRVLEARTNLPVPSAEVTLSVRLPLIAGFGDDPASPRSATTLADGSFTDICFFPGAWYVYVEHPAYSSPSTFDVEIKYPGPFQKDFYLGVLPVFSCEVTDAESGEPVAGAQVYGNREGFHVQIPYMDFSQPHGITDESGRVERTRFYIPSAEKVESYQFLVVAASHVPQLSAPVAYASDGMHFALALSRGGALRGRVISATGEPVRFVPLNLFREHTSPGSFPIRWHAGTPASGTFAFENLPDGVYRLSSPLLETPRVEISQRREINDYVLQLPSVLTVAGRVVDGRGRAVAGAWLDFFQNGRPVSFPTGVRTDVEGRFTVPDVPSGTLEVRLRYVDPEAAPHNHLRFDPAGFKQQYWIEGPADAELVVQVEPPYDDAELGRVAGRVVDGAGRPFSERVRVSLWGRPRPGPPPYRAETVADAEGEFHFEGVPSGERLDFAAVVEGDDRLEGQLNSLPQFLTLEPGEAREGVVITVRRGARIEGTLRDADGNSLDALVWAFTIRDGRKRPLRTARPSTPGGQYVFNQLPAGEIELYDEHNHLLKRLTVAEGDVLLGVDLTITSVKASPVHPVELEQLPEAASAAITVTDRAGRPVAGAKVEIASESRGGKAKFYHVTGEDGTIVTRPLQFRYWSLWAKAPGYREFMQESVEFSQLPFVIVLETE
ncbi:carboxypeptidase regulatory-like domain-containing protein [bacterium]|nr:carboxypeptidase regulatory-like domain-containing protein [bacterium]